LDANKSIASELDKALSGSVVEADTPPITDGPSIVEERDDAAKSRDPNVAKDLTDAEKAELGGSGSGTPGGHEPEDEESGRNNSSPLDPKNRAQHEEYVDSLRVSMEKPDVKDENLKI